MRKLALLAVVSASALSVTGTAQAATCAFNGPVQECFIVAGLDSEFSVTFAPDGTISADIGRNGIGLYSFIDRYYFYTDADGMGSGTVTTSLSGSIGGSTDLDFTAASAYTNATFNGVGVPYVPPTNPIGVIVGGTQYVLPVQNLGGGIEVIGTGGGQVAITGFTQNYIEISGISRGNGSYGGNVTFTPNAAVPEPATWAMMLFGFGAIGFGMRRRRKEPTRVRFAIS